MLVTLRDLIADPILIIPVLLVLILVYGVARELSPSMTTHAFDTDESA